MSPHLRILSICGLTAAIAGQPAKAGEERRMADEPGEVRVDGEALRNLLTPARQVTVVGTAKVSVVPDLAEVTVGVTTSKPTAKEAVRDNNAEMNRLIDALKGRGVAPKDIQTSELSISPLYSRPAEPKPGVPEEATAPKIVAYQVTNTVRVSTRDRTKIGEIVDAVVEAGSNQMQGISFRVEDPEKVQETLRGKAFDAARAKAELYATRSGMALGQPLQITEGSAAGPMPPQPQMMFRMAAADTSMPVSPGEQEISLSVTVSFELKASK
ncbi:SIMPL domain-containing protein [Tundrisphaera lichenicola]|uniref:SIMPL domain-containing protein n=1 Tax=Tundrisphaera lichenicola TaxID=2029860 RepID=UPI003EBA8730